MDSEQKIKQLQEDIRHERAMRKLQSDRLDAHDVSFDAIRGILAETARIQAQTAEHMQQTQDMIKDLIAALLRGRENGKS